LDLLPYQSGSHYGSGAKMYEGVFLSAVKLIGNDLLAVKKFMSMLV
jgi:hypothetical protein